MMPILQPDFLHPARVPPFLLFPWCPFLSRIFGIWLQHIHSVSPIPIVPNAHPLAGFSASGNGLSTPSLLPTLWPEFHHLATASPLLLSSLFCGRNFVIWQRCLHSFSNLPREPNLPILLPNLDTLTRSQTAYIENELCGEH